MLHNPKITRAALTVHRSGISKSVPNLVNPTVVVLSRVNPPPVAKIFDNAGISWECISDLEPDTIERSLTAVICWTDDFNKDQEQELFGVFETLVAWYPQAFIYSVAKQVETRGLVAVPNRIHTYFPEDGADLVEHLRHYINSEVRRLSPSGYEFEFNEFPDHIATACEQYLLYFKQFLSDIGVKASTNIDHVAHKLLFSVVPSDRAVALEQVESALRDYLIIPVVLEPSLPSSSTEIAVLRLESQVSNLTSALRLALAEVQTREERALLMSERLQDRDYEIMKLRAQIESPSLISDALTLKPAETEQLIGGIVEIGKFDVAKGGLKISGARIIQIVRKRFSKQRDNPE